MSANIAVYQEKLAKLLKQPGTINDTMTLAEQKSGVQRIYIAYGVIGLVVIWLAFGMAAQLLASAIGFVYPAYWSIKALESGSKGDDTQWLTYWVVFAAFSVIEFFADFLVNWIPFYWLIKCVFLIWCMSPLNGSTVIYNRLIRPAFKKHESKLDEIVNKAASKAGDLFDKAQEVAGDHIKAN